MHAATRILLATGLLMLTGCDQAAGGGSDPHPVIAAGNKNDSAVPFGVTKWRFTPEQSGATPKEFTDAAGTWAVVKNPDDSAPEAATAGADAEYVLMQQAKSAGSVFNLALANTSNYLDLDLSVRMKAIAGESDQGGGLVWRAKDAKNYYIVRFNPLESNFRLYKVMDGNRTQLQSADIPAQPGWHTIGVSMAGNEIRCTFDGREYLHAHDDTFTTAGMIGLWTKADAQSCFAGLTAGPPSSVK